MLSIIYISRQILQYTNDCPSRNKLAPFSGGWFLTGPWGSEGFGWIQRSVLGIILGVGSISGRRRYNDMIHNTDIDMWLFSKTQESNDKMKPLFYLINIRHIVSGIE